MLLAVLSAIAVRLGWCARSLGLFISRTCTPPCPPETLLPGRRGRNRPLLGGLPCERGRNAHLCYTKSKQKQRAALRGPALLKQVLVGSCFCLSRSSKARVRAGACPWQSKFARACSAPASTCLLRFTLGKFQRPRRGIARQGGHGGAQRRKLRS